MAARPAENVSTKRLRGSPTGLTPSQEAKRKCCGPVAAKKELFPATESSAWTDTECSALVEFLLLHRDPQKWSKEKTPALWDSASKHVQQRIGASRRSGSACRTKVTKDLSVRFKSPAEAEKTLPKLPMVVESTLISDPGDVEDVQAVGVYQNTLTISDLSKAFSEFAKRMDVTVSSDFLLLSLQAMKHLNEGGRGNVLDALARGIGTKSKDGTDSLFPVKRMPMGLLEHMANFFAAEIFSSVPSCPEDYCAWLSSMYCLFGTKWCKLYLGPLWSVEPIVQQGETATIDTHARYIHDARVNVPGLHERTIRRDIAGSKLSTGPEIQIAVLNEATRLLPAAEWWIKADGVDVVSGLSQSVNLDWSGDVDLNDGMLKKMHTAYLKRLTTIQHAALSKDPQVVQFDLRQLDNDLCSDLEFIHQELKKASTNYSSKYESGKSTNQNLYALGWKVNELEDLMTEGRNLRTEIQVVKDTVGHVSWTRNNIPRKLTDIRLRLTSFVKSVTHHRLVAATHLLVIMISPEDRSHKPYALPVQCIPYTGMPEARIRDLVNKLVKEMHNRGMSVAGLVTNGEHNGLRLRGNTRPLHVFDIRAQVKRRITNTKVTILRAMLTPKVLNDGTVSAMYPSEVIPNAVLEEVLQLMRGGISLDDVISRFRSRTVPPGYPIHSWRPDKSETPADMVRSVVAQLEFTHWVRKYHHELGVPFCTHLYVPEKHPTTSRAFHEREDEGHVFKRIGQQTRVGGPSELRLQRFLEATEFPETQLTYTALTGHRKQSITDVERLFNPHLAKWMKEHEYEYEGKYVQTIHDWRRAVDERGLSELERSEFNQNFLELILDELLPWHKDMALDYSTLEVNRSLSGVLGFTYETLVAVTTDIESREVKRIANMEEGLPSEHPRSSTTDDVECFFSVMRDLIGKNFTVKKAQFEWRKLCLEYQKRMDPALPFFYYTSSNDRFYEGPRASFDQPGRTTSKNPRHQRARKSELIGLTAPSRVSVAQSGAKSIRTTFHNPPSELPPPPNAPVTFEHSYCK